ncbi:hypothetical protein ACQ4LE_000110 [Meloidogyne hapla]|uniref:ZP domain-containing protein n=1 Tax=Meloidogyne hapla TaxID=6305 RepID=A0A1I8C1N5_MELHA
MNFQLLAAFIVLLLGTSKALKCKFSSIDITEAETPQEQLTINKTAETTEYECPAEDKNCINLEGFLTSQDPQTGEERNKTFGLKSCESDLARFMLPIEQKIQQEINYTCGASPDDENRTAGPLTYSINCCSTDECNVSNENNTFEISFPNEETITVIAQKDEENNKEFNKENNNQENENPPQIFEGENNTTINEENTISPFLLDNSTQQQILEEQNNTSTNKTEENPKNGVPALFNTFTMFSLLTTCLLVGSLMIAY